MESQENNSQQNAKQLNDTYQAAVNEGKNSMRRKQKERYIRKKRKRIKHIKAFLRIVLLAILLYCAYLFIKMPQWYLKSDAFSKSDQTSIEVINNYIVPQNIIYNSIKDIKVTNKPIFLFGVSEIKKELFKIPVIKNIYVRRYGFPARIQIIIRERIPSVVLKTDVNSMPFAFITTDGVLISNKIYMPLSEAKSPLKIIVKNTAEAKNWDLKRIDFIEKIVKSVEAYSSEKVQYIDMKDPNDVYVKIESTNIRLGVLDSLVFERIKRIYTILPQISEIDGKVKYVDLSWDRVNYLKLEDQKTKEKEEKATTKN